ALLQNWKESAKSAASAATAFRLLNPSNDPAKGSSECAAGMAAWDALWREQEKLDAAVTLVAGIHVEANADRSVVPVGDEFAIRARIRCRPEVECIGGFPVLARPDGMKEVKRSPDKGDSQATITIQVEGNPETGPLTFLEPIGHSRMGISTRMNV